MKTPVELLQEGRDRLMRDGWVKSAFVSTGNRHCALGALFGTELTVATRRLNETETYTEVDYYHTYDQQDPNVQRAHDYLITAIPKSLPAKRYTREISAGVPGFNDHLDTQFNDVIALYDRAILAAKEGEGTHEDYS